MLHLPFTAGHVAEHSANGCADQRAPGVATDDLTKDCTSDRATPGSILGGFAGLDILT